MAAGFGNPMLGGGNGGMPPRTQVNLTAKDLKQVLCESCGGRVFNEGMMFFIVSALLSPTGKEEIRVVPAPYCIECNTTMDKFLPDDLKEKKVTL